MAECNAFYVTLESEDGKHCSTPLEGSQLRSTTRIPVDLGEKVDGIVQKVRAFAKAREPGATT